MAKSKEQKKIEADFRIFRNDLHFSIVSHDRLFDNKLKSIEEIKKSLIHETVIENNNKWILQSMENDYQEKRDYFLKELKSKLKIYHTFPTYLTENGFEQCSDKELIMSYIEECKNITH